MIESWRDRQSEEHARFDFLLRLYEVTRRDPRGIVHAGELGYEMGLSDVQTYAVAEFLAAHGYVEYLGAGPRVRIAPRGIRYIEWEADTRRTIR